MEQRTLNCCVRVLLVCECRRWQRVSVALPALLPGVDACRRILNRRQCATGLREKIVPQSYDGWKGVPMGFAGRVLKLD